MAVLVLAVQLAAGGMLSWAVACLVDVRRRGMAAPEKAVLARGAWLAAAVVVVIETYGRIALTKSLLGDVWASAAYDVRWLALGAGALAAPGCWLLLAAGGREAAGKLEAAGRLARLGGLVTSAGVAGQSAANALALASVGLGRPPRGLYALALATGLAAGGAALLGGLSRKPRPSGHLAAALLVLSTIAWVAAG